MKKNRTAYNRPVLPTGCLHLRTADRPVRAYCTVPVFRKNRAAPPRQHQQKKDQKNRNAPRDFPDFSSLFPFDFFCLGIIALGAVPLCFLQLLHCKVYFTGRAFRLLADHRDLIGKEVLAAHCETEVPLARLRRILPDDFGSLHGLQHRSAPRARMLPERNTEPVRVVLYHRSSSHVRPLSGLQSSHLSAGADVCRFPALPVCRMPVFPARRAE